MGLNTYPSNPFPPSTDRMDADVLEAEVNKLESDVDQLKSGLTNYQAQNNLNLEVPNRKNILAYTLESLKSRNTQGTWSGNDYTREGVVFSVATDANGNVASITADGEATSDNAIMFLFNGDMSNCAGAILSGAPVSTDMVLKIGKSTSPYTSYAEDNGSGAVIANGVIDNAARAFIKVNNGKTADNAVFTPMVRPAFITDTTFVPYIPSVESRIEAVESGLVYSATEIDTGKTWVDGRKIYRKYFTTTITAAQTEGTPELTTIAIGAIVRDFTDFFMVTTAVQGVYTPFFNIDTAAKNTLRVLLRNNDAGTGLNSIHIYNYSTAERTANLYVEYTK